MAGPATVRSGRRRRGRPPGIRAAVIARVRRAAGRISSVDSSSTMAFAGGRGRPADSGCSLRSGSRRPFRSSRADSWRDVNVDVDSRRREISLGKRPVDCTVGAAVGACSSSVAGGSVPAVWPASVRPGILLVEVVDRTSASVSDFPAGVHLYGSLVGDTTFHCRPRVVPLCAAGIFGRPTPLVMPTPLMEHFRVVCARRKRILVRSYWSGRKRVRVMQPPFSKDNIQLVKATFRGCLDRWFVENPFYIN
ncbi:hypothetical protein VPH35_092063 [Triticum aestivum]